MEELKIHSEGQKDHLGALKKKYDKLKKTLKGNPRLTEEQKQTELKKLNVQLKKDKRNSSQNLY